MARKNAKSRLRKSRRVAARRKDKKASHLRSIFVLAGPIVILAGLVGWAICSDTSEWRDWLGGMRATHLSSGSTDGESGGSEAGEGQTLYQGSGYATLGEFSVDRVDPITDTTLTVCFQLGGQTACKGEEEFVAFMDDNCPSFHEHVAGAVRDCDFSSLTNEQSLGRKVVVRVNRLLGRHFLKSVEFDELTVYETVGESETTIWRPGKAREE